MASSAANIILGRVIDFAKNLNYPVENLKDHRTIGPIIGVRVPPPGCELELTEIPPNIYEDELFPFLSSVGPIYKFRLMLSFNNILHRGFGYVTYENKQSANLALMQLNDVEIKPGVKINIKSINSKPRVFIGGIPNCKTKVEVWHELAKIGMKKIADVIMYRNYLNRQLNRGFVFVEFSTYEDACMAKRTFKYKQLNLFGNTINIDWSTLSLKSDSNSSFQIQTLILKYVPDNVHDKINDIIFSLLTPNMVQKVKMIDGDIFIDFKSRRDAQKGMCVLKEYFKLSSTKIMWLKREDAEKSLSRLYAPSNNNAIHQSTSQTSAATPAYTGSLVPSSFVETDNSNTNNLNDSLPDEMISMINCLLQE